MHEILTIFDILFHCDLQLEDESGSRCRFKEIPKVTSLALLWKHLLPYLVEATAQNSNTISVGFLLSIDLISSKAKQG